MKKILLIIVCFSFLAAINAYSAEIAWMYVQHRTYGEGSSVNRLGFGLIDKQLSYLTSDSAISEVKLFNSQGKEMKMSPHRFGKVSEIYGSYDSKNSQWRYSKNWQFDSWFHVDILEELIPGKYEDTKGSAWQLNLDLGCARRYGISGAAGKDPGKSSYRNL
jgi:hypothetical protein